MVTRAIALGEPLITLLQRIRHYHRRSVAFVVYAGIALVAYSVAYLLRFDFVWRTAYTTTFLLSYPILLLARYFAHQFFRLTTSRWRYVGMQDVVRLGGSIVLGTILFLVVDGGELFPRHVPISVVVIEALLSFVLIAGSWMSYRAAFEAARYWVQTGGGQEARRVLIVGAGESGYALAREMMRRSTGYRPVAFVDDDPHKKGTLLAGLRVLGGIPDLPRVARHLDVQELVLALPHATPGQMRRVVEQCEATALPYRVLPSIAEVLAGEVRLEQIREVRIEDLLGREPVKLDLQELAMDLRDGCALITGAAGSIGSELARQVAMHHPRTLVLFDQAETELYYLELELRERFPDLAIVPLIGDIVDSSAVEHVFATFRPSHVFHAAAYKHVPMMETNVREAVQNNVVGTRRVAEAAGRYGAAKFVLVSTDKAVRPSSVMGATKRLAEVVTLELQARYFDTIYAAVRFGNVLGSNGSVIPLFRRQLAAGRPLTVTHPDVTRYFMTIPEAVQLILQASLLPEIRGHIAMLEMGEPVRIVDLARNLLRLSGHGRNGRNLVFTGLRPGEKLHEELVAPEEETVETVISKVRLIRRSELEGPALLERLPSWEVSLREGRLDGVVAELHRLFPRLRGPLPATVEGYEEESERVGVSAASVPL